MIMYKIDIRDSEVTQNALRKLRAALGYDALSELDATAFILMAKTRINCLTEEVNGTYKPKEK